MTNEISPAAPPAPQMATQAVTVVQPAPRPMTIDVGHAGTIAGAIVAIAAVFTLLYKLITHNMNRDIREVKHKVGNVTGRMDAIEHLRASDIERIVRVETSLGNVEKGMDRVERTINDRFDTLAGSIREIRTVAPRA